MFEVAAGRSSPHPFRRQSARSSRASAPRGARSAGRRPRLAAGASPSVTMWGSPKSSPTISRPPGFSTRAISRSAASWSGISPSTVIRIAASKLSSSQPSCWASPSVGLTFQRPRSRARANRVVEHLLLDVEDLDHPLVADPGRQVERVVAGSGADLEQALARPRLEDLAQAGAGDQRVRRLDPEPLAVRTGRGVLAPPQARRPRPLPRPSATSFLMCPRSRSCGGRRRRGRTPPGAGRARSRRPRIRGRTSSPPRFAGSSVDVSASRSASRCLAARRALITWPPPNPISTRFISSAIDSPLGFAIRLPPARPAR